MVSARHADDMQSFRGPSDESHAFRDSQSFRADQSFRDGQSYRDSFHNGGTMAVPTGAAGEITCQVCGNVYTSQVRPPARQRPRFFFGSPASVVQFDLDVHVQKRHGAGGAGGTMSFPGASVLLLICIIASAISPALGATTSSFAQEVRQLRIDVDHLPVSDTFNDTVTGSPNPLVIFAVVCLTTEQTQ